MASRTISPRQLWLRSRASKDWDQFFDVSQEILSRRPHDTAVLRSLARVALETRGPDESIPRWQALLEVEPYDLEAAYHLRRLEPGARQLAALGEEEMVRLDDADRAVAETPPATRARHVAICGVSYCGSTLIDRLLGGLPGVGSIGESHWLIKHRTADGQYLDFDLRDDLDTIRLVGCSVCGHRCEVLSPAFRLGLAADHSEWYPRIARRLGASVLISADKNVRKLVDNDPLLRLDSLVIFKTPDQAWRSELNKRPAGRSDDYYEDECQKYAEVWTRNYRYFLDDFRPTGKSVFMSFDEFTQAPARHLEAICRALELQYDPNVLSRTVPGHAIGGNNGSMRRLRENDYSVNIETLPPSDLPARHRQILDGNVAMGTAYRELRNRYLQTFGGAIW